MGRNGFVYSSGDLIDVAAVEIVHDEPENIGPPTGQTSGPQVGNIAQAFHGFDDTVPRGHSDIRVTIGNSRHRRGGDARLDGNIEHRHGSAASWSFTHNGLPDPGIQV